MTIAFFGKGVFAEVTKLRILRRDHPELSGWFLNPMINCPYKIQRWEDKDRGEGLEKQKQRLELYRHKPRNAPSYQNLGKAGKDSLLRHLERNTVLPAP